MGDPPQGRDEYRELKGNLFPEEYPFDFARLFDMKYFFLKYYMS